MYSFGDFSGSRLCFHDKRMPAIGQHPPISSVFSIVFGPVCAGRYRAGCLIHAGPGSENTTNPRTAANAAVRRNVYMIIPVFRSVAAS